MIKTSSSRVSYVIAGNYHLASHLCEEALKAYEKVHGPRVQFVAILLEYAAGTTS